MTAEAHSTPKFLRHVLTLMTGTAIGQAIPIVIAPVLSRLYTPEDFGFLAVFTGCVALLAPIATAAYEQAIVLPKKDEDAIGVFLCATFLSAVVGALSMLVVLFFKAPIARILNVQDGSVWLYLVPLNVLLIAVTQALMFWWVRRRDYRLIAGSRVVQSVTSGGLNLGMGIAGCGVSGLIIGGLVGQGLSSGLLAWPFLKEKNRVRDVVKRSEIIKQASIYSDFPKYNLPQAFLDAMRESSLVFLICHFFGSTVLGLYWLAMRVLKIPLNLLGSAIAQVFYKEAVEIHNGGQKMWPLLWKVLRKTLLVVLPLLLLVVAFGPSLFSAVFGQEWRQAGRIASALSPWILMMIVSSPISQIPLILGRQKDFLVVGAAFNVLIPLVFLGAAMFTGNVVESLFVVSAVAAVFLLSIVYWMARLSGYDGMFRRA